MKTNSPRIAVRVFTFAALGVLASSPSTRTIAGPKLTQPASSTVATQARLAESDGKFKGRLKSTGLRPKFLDRLAERGVHVEAELFALETKGAN